MTATNLVREPCRAARRPRVIATGALLCVLAAGVVAAQEPQLRFGGAYSGLGERRQRLVDNWVARFTKTTGQRLDAAPFYDDILSLSAKTTFDAVTHALMTTPLTTTSGMTMGDALSLIEYVETVNGQKPGIPGDRQFRLYVSLTANGLETLARSQEFKRGIDNTVFHKGYPVSYRARGGTPSIQISITPDGRRADIDVDYRSSSFPAAMFNGHLTASNSDIRAGNNAERHAGRWAGLQNWWQSFFGIRLSRAPGTPDEQGALALPKAPRAGKKNIDVMVHDFLSAWLLEGDVLAAMGYISARAYACVGQGADDPSSVDRGMAPFQLMINLKAAHESLGKRASLDGLVVGVRLAMPSLKVVQQPYHAQFVIYSVPDDVAAAFDCESRLAPAAAKATRSYGNYFGSALYISGQQEQRLTLLWAREEGYWRIVSWQTGIDDGSLPAPAVASAAPVARVKAPPGLPQAARGFLESWLLRKDYDAAFRYLSTRSYACYDLARAPEAPASTSLDDAGRKIRASLERTGQQVGAARNLGTVLEAADPVHPAVRVVDHPDLKVFTLTSIPTALGDVAECDARAKETPPPDPLPPVYGEAFGMNVRFRTQGGEAAVLRLLWRNEDGAWRIRSYDVELP